MTIKPNIAIKEITPDCAMSPSSVTTSSLNQHAEPHDDAERGTFNQSTQEDV